MKKVKILSGEELVAKGATKHEATLPETGLKEVVPNGSWLEKKQIQTALESWKELVAVERIEKSGILSHASWNEGLGLAEVTQISGGYWQFLGHSVGKQLYLKPEEALFLIEVNCLRLTYNDVLVSLQQAYSLLLRYKVRILQYKVYASLSRLGYKVYQHEYKKDDIDKSQTPNIEEKVDVFEPAETIAEKTQNSVNIKENITENIGNVIDPAETTSNSIDNETENITENADKTMNDEDNTKSDKTGDNNKSQGPNIEIKNDVFAPAETIAGKTQDSVNIEENIRNVIDPAEISSDFFDNKTDDITEKHDKTMDVDENINDEDNKKSDLNNIAANTETANETRATDEQVAETAENKELPALPSRKEMKLQKLRERKWTTISKEIVSESFEHISEIVKKSKITLPVPPESLLPRNVFPNKSSYVISMEHIQNKPQSPPRPSRTYSASDEVNFPSVPSIRAPNIPSPSTFLQIEAPNFPAFYPQMFSQPPFLNRPFQSMWGSPFPRFFRMPPRFGRPRFFQFPFRYPMPPNMRPPNLINFYNQRRRRNRTQKSQLQKTHLEAINHLSTRMKLMISRGSTDMGIVTSMSRLIQTYNDRYNTNLRLDINFDVIEDVNVVETIELEDDETPEAQSRKTSNVTKFDENLKEIKDLASRLKDLHNQGKATARHRRAFSGLIKKFNKSFDADIYLNDKSEIIDRKQIILESSDSDCIIEEPTPKRRKLKNPFSILKNLPTEAKEDTTASTSTQDNNNDINIVADINNDSDAANHWHPPSTDFGAPEVVPKHRQRDYIQETAMELYLFDFLRDYDIDFENWKDVKISFWENVEEDNRHTEVKENEPKIERESLINLEECSDMNKALEKVKIIPYCNTKDDETSLVVDFDVYNRDVQNFKKSNKPRPHYRIVCVDVNSGIPSGSDIAALYSKYPDGVDIVFAIVSGGSISYIEMKPKELPVYVRTEDET